MKPYFVTIACAAALAACSLDGERPVPQAEITAPAQFETFNNPHLDVTSPVLALRDGINDPELTRLINATLQNNNDLKIAKANLEQARALRREATGDQYPEVFANAGANRQKLSESFITPGEREFSAYDLGFDTIWEIDLFGKKSALVRAARYDVKSSAALSRGLAITLAAETAKNYVELRGEQRRLKVLQRNADNQKQSLKLTETLAEFGEGDMLDVERAKTAYELTRAVIPGSNAKIRASINRLAVLTGQEPETIREKLARYAPLPNVPAQIALGSPEALLRRRPDIQAADYALSAAIARYDFSVADLYPTISLQGSFGFLSQQIGELASSGTSRFLFGPTLSYNLLDFGQTRARIDASDAAARAKLAAFEQSLLIALEEIDNATVSFANAEKTRFHFLQAAISAAKSAQSARDRFDAGEDNFLNVLDADRTLLSAEDQLTQSETDLLLRLIGVYKALGV